MAPTVDYVHKLMEVLPAAGSLVDAGSPVRSEWRSPNGLDWLRWQLPTKEPLQKPPARDHYYAAALANSTGRHDGALCKMGPASASAA